MDRYIKIWDMKTFKCINTLRGHLNTIWCIEYID